jgi:hypothetical protein
MKLPFFLMNLNNPTEEFIPWEWQIVSHMPSHWWNLAIRSLLQRPKNNGRPGGLRGPILSVLCRVWEPARLPVGQKGPNRPLVEVSQSKSRDRLTEHFWRLTSVAIPKITSWPWDGWGARRADEVAAACFPHVRTLLYVTGYPLFAAYCCNGFFVPFDSILQSTYKIELTTAEPGEKSEGKKRKDVLVEWKTSVLKL